VSELAEHYSESDNRRNAPNSSEGGTVRKKLKPSMALAMLIHEAVFGIPTVSAQDENPVRNLRWEEVLNE
jgi:hypothetical protein